MSRGRVVVFGWAVSAHVQRWLPAMAETGFEMKLISLGDESRGDESRGDESRGAASRADDPLEGIETVCLPRAGQISYYTLRSRAAKLAHRMNPDLIHVHYAGGFGLWAIKAKLHPTLVSVWGSDVENAYVSRIKRHWLKRTLDYADRVTATSNYLAKAAADIAPEVSAKLSVIPFGVTRPAKIAPLPPMPPLRICYLKAHEQVYGPDVLLKAISLAKENGVEIALTMAGQGALTESLKKLAGELKIREQVDFVGQVSLSEIYPLLNRHHLLVMPSRRESFGVAALESGICGRPVIASDVGGISEIVRHGKTGLLVAPDDPQELFKAIIELASNSELMATMGESGRTVVEKNYLWEQSVEKMANLYERLISVRRK
ncbi:MAG: glycosyltransferase family 4 protein [bacterium]|nr:glycosyltransferase family 4 protein [bacterium]